MRLGRERIGPNQLKHKNPEQLTKKFRNMKIKTLVAVVTFVSLGQIAGLASIAIADNYETDTSGNYTVVNDGTPNGTVTFGFDYVAAGIPLAPRSTAGDTKGLRFTANDSLTAVDAWTAFHNTTITAPKYIMTVDVYMRFDALVASTEYAHVGVGGNGTTFNSIFTPISGSGSFMAFTGDGGSASDYRWYLDAANGGPTTYAATDASHLGHGANNTGAFYQALFPGGTVVGSPGNLWTTVEITVDNVAKSIQYRMDGQLVFDSTPNGPFTGNLNGLVSLGYSDPFTSVASPANNIYGVFDNLTVELVPEPSSLALVGLGGLALLARRRK
jgi:hypothetical protein